MLARPLNRLDSHPQLKPIVVLIGKLKQKDDELKSINADHKNDNDLASRKHIILSELIAKVDNACQTFNRVHTSSDAEEQAVTQSFVQQLQAYMLDIFFDKEKRECILKPRNGKQALANFAANTTTVASLGGGYYLAAALNAPAALSVAATAIVATKVVYPISCMLFKSDDLMKKPRGAKYDAIIPASAKILGELCRALYSIGGAPAFNVANNEGISPAYQCALTHKLMQDPVVCSLDNKTYERDAIVAWLFLYGATPTGVALKTNKSIESVLVDNENIKSLIQERQRALAPA